LDDALASIGVNPKTGKSMITKPVYDKDGNDVSVKPIRRLGKLKGESDKDFDTAFDRELKPTRQDIAKQKVADVKLDQQARAEAIVAVTLASGIAVAGYLAKRAITKNYNQALVAKYGPAMAELILKGS
jgi:hypothetical protein